MWLCEQSEDNVTLTKVSSHWLTFVGDVPKVLWGEGTSRPLSMGTVPPFSWSCPQCKGRSQGMPPVCGKVHGCSTTSARTVFQY